MKPARPAKPETSRLQVDVPADLYAMFRAALATKRTKINKAVVGWMEETIRAAGLPVPPAVKPKR